MFQIDISKHVEKSPENFEKSKTRKNNRQNSENTIFAKKKPESYVENYTAGHLCTKFEEFILIYKATIAKIEFDLGCKLGQIDPTVMKLKLDMSCHLLKAYTKFQIDISKPVEKSPENSDGRTDRRTDITAA